MCCSIEELFEFKDKTDYRYSEAIIDECTGKEGKGKSLGSISGQLDSLIAYLEKHNPSLLERLKTSDSVEDAATAFLREYEKCKDLDREEIERVSAAKQIYEVFQEYQSPVE